MACSVVHSACKIKILMLFNSDENNNRVSSHKSVGHKTHELNVMNKDLDIYTVKTHLQFFQPWCSSKWSRSCHNSGSSNDVSAARTSIIVISYQRCQGNILISFVEDCFLALSTLLPVDPWTPRGSGRRRGSPTKTWQSTEDLVDRRVDWNSVRAVATNRSRWRTLAAHCPVKERRI